MIKDSNTKLFQSVLILKRPPSNATRNRRTETPWKSERVTGSKIKVADGITNHWCDYNKRWNLHTTEDCKERKTESAKSNIQSNNSTSRDVENVYNTVSYAATFSTTMAAIHKEEGGYQKNW